MLERTIVATRKAKVVRAVDHPNIWILRANVITDHIAACIFPNYDFQIWAVDERSEASIYKR
jgi:hypothetical protein